MTLSPEQYRRDLIVAQHDFKTAIAPAAQELSRAVDDLVVMSEAYLCTNLVYDTANRLNKLILTVGTALDTVQTAHARHIMELSHIEVKHSQEVAISEATAAALEAWPAPEVGAVVGADTALSPAAAAARLLSRVPHISDKK